MLIKRTKILYNFYSVNPLNLDESSQKELGLGRVALGHVDAVDDARRDHGAELVEDLRVLLLAREPHHGADVEREVELVQPGRQVEHLHRKQE